MQDSTGEQATVLESWLALEPTASEGLTLDVHPDDEMARVDLQKTSAERSAMFYMRTGWEACRVLENMLAAAGRSLGSTKRVLDFACGYGRVLRHMIRGRSTEHVYASDIVRPAVDFVSRTFGVHGIASAANPGAVSLPGGLDLITVFSLFSHLPRKRFVEFLALLHEQLSDEGLLLFSTHSPFAIDAAARDASGFTYQPQSGIPHLDTSEYGSTFVRPDVVEALCAEAGIGHVWHLERELWRIQDVYVVAKEPVPSLDRWTHASICRGAILRADITPAGLAFVGGYVRTPTTSGRVESVEVVVDGDARYPCRHAPHPLALPESEGGRHFTQTDWFVEGQAAELLGGSHVVAALGSVDGNRSVFDVTLLAPS